MTPAVSCRSCVDRRVGAGCRCIRILVQLHVPPVRHQCLKLRYSCGAAVLPAAIDTKQQLIHSSRTNQEYVPEIHRRLPPCPIQKRACRVMFAVHPAGHCRLHECFRDAQCMQRNPKSHRSATGTQRMRLLFTSKFCPPLEDAFVSASLLPALMR